MKFKIKKVDFRIRFFGNNSRIPNINRKLKIEFFTLSRIKVYEKILFLMNRFGTIDKDQNVWFD